MTDEGPDQGQQEAQDLAPQTHVIGLAGGPVQMPAGRWLAKVTDGGNLATQDGLLVRMR